jgi:peptidoglycan/xylan/chitin deacetylase (PgdA/CDA1 family)
VRIPELRSEPFPIAKREDRAKAVVAVRDEARRQGYAPGDEGPLVRSIARHLSLDADAIYAKHQLELMSEEDVSRLSKGGVDFQLHTHTHNTPRDPERFAQEIETNRDRIQGLTGRATPHFCYPSGQYDPLFLPWLAKLGVRSATTCDPGLASPATPPLMLPRFLDTSSTAPELFQSWLTGTSAWLSRRRSYAARPA